MELQREDLERFYAGSFHKLHEGAILKGEIIQIKQEGVIVSIGYKCEGFVPVSEFSQDELCALKPGRKIDVYVVNVTASEGFIHLSKDKATKIKTWEVLEEASHKGLPIKGKIIGKVKGGMTVDISGIKAFLPGSQIDVKASKDTDHLIGQTLPFKVIKVDNQRSNVIVSRRILLEEERNKLREKTLASLKEGEIVKGIVKNITDYGAFIDIGGVDGLVHISDMSWGRIRHPGEVFSIGDTVEVVVIKFEREAEKVTLGYKQKKPDPWADAEEKYPPGKKVLGKVINIAEYGIFVELEEGIEGLVHATEIDWSGKVKKPSRYFSIGDTVEAVILKVTGAEKKISLSIKQLKSNPWELIKQRYTVGQRVTGVVRSLTDFGAFISLDEGIDALLHMSDMSWTKHIKHPSEILKRGQKIESLILNIEPEKEKMALGLKQMTPDPWVEEIPNKYNTGDNVKGRIVRIADGEVYIELKEGVEALIVSFPQDALHKKISDIYKIGDELSGWIVKVDREARMIDLSTEDTGEIRQ